MAKRHLIPFLDYLNNNLFTQFNELNLKIGNQLKTSMVDPELEEELKAQANTLENKLYSLSSLLSLAIKDNKAFMGVGRSQRQLIKQVKNTMSKVKDQEPDSPLVKDYEAMILNLQQPLYIYNSIDYLRIIPNRKKKAKKYKGYVPTFTDFQPFILLQAMLDKLKALADEVSDE